MYDYILNQFNGYDKMRPALLTPSRRGDNVYATNGHSAIKIPARLLMYEYHTHEKFPTEDGLNNLFEKEASNIKEISTEKLAATLAKTKYYYLHQYCDKCNGNGTMVCPCCDHENDCNECDGTGIGDIYPFRVKKASQPTIKLGQRYFSPHLIDCVLVAAIALKKDVIEIINDQENMQGTIFRLPGEEVKMLIMPTTQYS